MVLCFIQTLSPKYVESRNGSKFNFEQTLTAAKMISGVECCVRKQMHATPLYRPLTSRSFETDNCLLRAAKLTKRFLKTNEKT